MRFGPTDEATLQLGIHNWVAGPGAACGDLRPACTGSDGFPWKGACFFPPAGLATWPPLGGGILQALQRRFQVLASGLNATAGGLEIGAGAGVGRLESEKWLGRREVLRCGTGHLIAMGSFAVPG